MENFSLTKIIRDKIKNKHFVITNNKENNLFGIEGISIHDFDEKKFDILFDSLSFCMADKASFLSLETFILEFRMQNELLSGFTREEINYMLLNSKMEEKAFSENEFKEIIHLVIEEYFNMQVDKIIGSGWKFESGKYYFNEDSYLLIGCVFSDFFWGLAWEPYI